ncbi:retrotransposon ORF1 [Tanacetum coccineum]
METYEISERYISPCFVNGLKANDGKINLAFDENLISNEFAIKLCLDYEMKKRKKFVKKELIVALKGELYFVKFIINPEEDDFEPGVILGRPFLRLAKGVADFGSEFGEELPPFICKMGKSNHKKKQAMENRNLFYQDIRPSSLAGDKVELDGKTLKEDEEAVKRIKGEALKEKDDPSAFIFPIRLEGEVNENALADTGSDINTMPYRIYKTLGREEMKKIDRGITMINHTQAEAMGKLSNVLCLVGVTTIIAKFLILDIPIDRDAPIVVGRGFLYTMGSILNTPQKEFSQPLMESVIKPSELRDLIRDAKSRYNTRLAQLLPRHIYSPCIVNWDVLDRMDCDGEIDDMLRIRFDEVCVDDELQTKKIIKFRLGGRANSLTLLEFARRLGLYQALSISQEHNLSLSRIHTSTTWRLILRLIHKMITYGLYQRTTGYEKVQKNDLWLLSMFDARHQNGYANVAWVIVKWMKRKRVGTQKESQICCGQFILKLSRKCRVLTKDVVRSLSTPVYCRDLDSTTLRDLIDSDGKLIPEDPESGMPRVGIPRRPRASMQDLYGRMGRVEIRQDAIERMEYRQSYYWDMYHGVFEHMVGVYSVPLQGAYNPPGYAQPQYDQYYQQYQPLPP